MDEFYPYFPSPMKVRFFADTSLEGGDGDDEMIEISYAPYEPSNIDKEIKIGVHFDLSDLFTHTRNFLIRNAGDKVYVNDLAGKHVVIVGFYIPIPKQEFMADLCRDVIATYDELKSKGINDFEFVLVTHMRPDFPEFKQDHVVKSYFSHFFSAFQCPAVPIDDITCSKKLLQAMGIYGSCHNNCLILSPGGEVLRNNLLLFRDYGAQCYPFTDEQFSELSCIMACIPNGDVSLKDLLCTTTCDVLSVPDCVISRVQMPLFKIRKRYVWLYLFNDATFFAQLLSMWAVYHEEVEVFLIFPRHANTKYRELILKTCREELMRFDTFKSRDKKFRILGCRMSPLLWRFSGRRTFDQLIVACHWFVDLHGAELCIDYSNEAFPFSKKLLYSSIVEKLRSITIQKVTSMLPLGLDLDGRDVFLYIGCSSRKLVWEHHLAEWCTAMKRFRPSLQLVFLCIGKKEVAPPDNSWISIPYEHTMKVYNMFARLKFRSAPTIYAYGADGNLVSIRAQLYLLDSDSTPSATFPDFSYLEEEVAIHLMQTTHYWSELFQRTWHTT